MVANTIQLPILRLRCGGCGNEWHAAIPNWDRGHVLVRRGSKCLFISDDVGYELNVAVDFTALLTPLGFLNDWAICPRCSKTGRYAGRSLLETEPPEKFSQPVTELEASDFELNNSKVSLKSTTIEILSFVEG